jgi:hypothetical protein
VIEEEDLGVLEKKSEEVGINLIIALRIVVAVIEEMMVERRGGMSSEGIVEKMTIVIEEMAIG